MADYLAFNWESLTRAFAFSMSYDRNATFDVIGDLLADACQVEQLLLDEGFFGLLGK